MSEAPATDSGPLTREQAVELLTERPEPEAQAALEAPVEAAAEPEEIEGEASAPEETEGEAETPADGEEAEAEAEPVVAVDPPKYWSQDAKAQFAQLPPELQAVVLAQEGPREEATAKAKAEAAAERQAANAELGKVQALAEHLNTFLPKAIEVFQSRWGVAPDWVAYAQENGAEAMVIAKAEHDQELALLQQTANATAKAQTEAREQYVKTEFATLAEIAPELADPEKGRERRVAVTSYLETEGLDPEAIKDISAREMRIAHKAMLWDQAQAALKARPTPKPAAPAPKAPIRPSAGQAQVPSEQREQQRLQNRFAQTATREDAVALILAKGL